jgi:hypothetical protein
MGATSVESAANAFDAVAERFDARYGAWKSVAAQRRLVRAALLRAFPPGAKLLEIGGGTGEDAAWLARQGREVLLTDVSPAMVRMAAEKLRLLGLPGGKVLLVIFGVCPPGEWVVQSLRGDLRAVFRRASRSVITARMGGRDFPVRYHREREVVGAMAPAFRLTGRRGIGIFVPPSAAEPWISSHPRILRSLEQLDRIASRPLAIFGDHVLYEFERTALRASSPA